MFTPLWRKKLEVHLCRGLDGIFHQLEVSTFLTRRDLSLQSFNSIRQTQIVSHTLAYVRFRPPINRTERVPVLLVRLLHPGAAHVLRLAVKSQAIVFYHERGEGVGQNLAKLPFIEIRHSFSLPKLILTIQRAVPHPLPSQVEKILHLILRRLDVAHVQDPHLPNATSVGLCELLPHEQGRESAQPEVIVRASPIGHMIIQSITTLSQTLLFVGEMTNVAIIIVCPHQGDIVRHLQPCVINVEHFLVGNKDLWNLADIRIHVSGQQLPLVINHLLQIEEFLLSGLHTLHGTIVHPTHTYCIDHILPLHLLQPLCPKLLHLRAVGHIVVLPHSSHLPLRSWRCAHRLAMGTSHIDTILVRHFAIACYGEKRFAHLVHGRPVVVGSQPQHQLENPLVGFRTYHPSAPRQNAPVFIVNEDASISHSGMFCDSKPSRQLELLLWDRHTIGPPHPRRHPKQTRHL